MHGRQVGKIVRGTKIMNMEQKPANVAGDSAHEAQIDENVDRLLTQVIDQALAEVETRQARGAIRQALAEEIRNWLSEIARREMAQQPKPASGNGLAPMAVGDAIQAGMTAAGQVQNLGFVDFTKGLIDGTFQAVIGATISQMEAYAKLVGDLSKELSQFQAENVGQGEITAHLSERYPDGKGGTSVRASFTFQPTDANSETGALAKTANQKLQEVVSSLVEETQALPAPYKLTRAEDSLNISSTSDQIVKFEDAHIQLIRPAIGRMLATSMMDTLRSMAREGMARIVITNGEILSKLTFDVNATSEQSKQTNEYHSDSLGVSARARAGWGWGSVAISGNYNQLNVKTVNERNFDNVTMSAEIIGQVKIAFKTETFPPFTTAATAPVGV